MEVQDYCAKMADELTQWKSKLSSVVTELDAAPESDKEELAPQIAEIQTIVRDMEGRVDSLKNECPTEWLGPKQDLDTLLGEVREKWERMKMLPPGRRLKGTNL